MNLRINLLNGRLGCLILILLIICIFFYIESRLTNLEHDRFKLEKALNQLDFIHDSLASSHNFLNNENLDNEVVVIYNRVPKTGSTSFVGVAYDLCKQNGFHVLHINITANMHVLSLANQIKFVQNITQWDDMKPAFYHGHMAFVDFAKFGVRTPLYINVLRKPLDRLVSYYYFLRYGDDYRPYLVRRKHGDKMTFDECVEKGQTDCDPNNMWIQIPFFCGHYAECWEPGNLWALEKAKQNLVQNYFLVGVTEELEDFIEMLEWSLPSMFHGAVKHYQTSDKSHLRRTIRKDSLSESTIEQIQKSPIWKMENELYEFALEQFHFVRKRSLINKQRFTYEKIRPK